LVAGGSYYLFSKRISVNVQQIAAFAKGNAPATHIVGAGE
jgi:hypothetical protein